jgi:N-succinyl-L-ornithine transcarbamylase
LNPEITKDSKLNTIKTKPLKTLILFMQKLGNYIEYGQITNSDPNWTVTADKMKLTNDAKFMHCLPVRRNDVSDEVIDGPNSIVIEQANNRTFAAQLVLQNIKK